MREDAHDIRLQERGALLGIGGGRLSQRGAAEQGPCGECGDEEAVHGMFLAPERRSVH